MTVNLYVSAFKGVGFACLHTFLIQILLILFSPISPDILEVPPESTWSRAPWNNHLKRVSKVGDGLLDKPEDVCFDEEGTLYTATRNGWIKKMHRNGSWEDWKMLGGDGLLGIVVSSKSGNLLVCDADKGLLQVNEEGVSFISTHKLGYNKHGVAIFPIENHRRKDPSEGQQHCRWLEQILIPPFLPTIDNFENLRYQWKRGHGVS